MITENVTGLGLLLDFGSPSDDITTMTARLINFRLLTWEKYSAFPTTKVVFVFRVPIDPIPLTYSSAPRARK